MDYGTDNAESHAQMASFWELAKIEIDELKQDQNAFKTQDLPLARIKKIMKLDDDVKAMMISAEAPILFAKAAELFIRELTLRAWVHTERNRRRTLQRNDVAMAVSDSDTDQFDFLIDIVPREETRGQRRTSNIPQSTSSPTGGVVTNNQTTPSNNNMNNNSIAGATSMKLDFKATTATPVSSITNGTIDTSGVVATTAVTTAQGMQQQQVSTAIISQQQLTSGAPIQYVLQLPAGATAGGGQSFQIQVLPQQFQMAESAGVSVNGSC